MQFEVSELDCPDFLARQLCSTTLPCLHFQALHHMTPQMERSDGVGPGRLGGVSCAFREDCVRFPMNVGWCIKKKIRDTHGQNEILCCFQRFLIRRSPRSNVAVDILGSRQHLRCDLDRCVVRHTRERRSPPRPAREPMCPSFFLRALPKRVDE